MSVTRFIPFSSFIRTLVLFVGLACFSISLTAQKEYLFNFRQLNIQDGLSSREVFDIHQDRQGLIWVATQQGLNRYDGHRFKWWTQKENGLSSNKIQKILEDQQGLMWLFSLEAGHEKFQNPHLDIFDPRNEQVQNFEDYFAANTPPFTLSELSTVYNSSEKELFFYTKNHTLWTFKKETGFQPIAIPDGFTPILFNANTFWIEKKGTLIELNFQGSVLRTIKTPADKLLTLVKGPAQVYIMIGADKANMPLVYLLNGATLKPVDLPDTFIQPSPMTVNYHQEDQNFWLANIYGLLVVDKNGQLIQFFDDREEDIIERAPHQLFFDRQGLGWLPTDNGIVLAQVKINPFTRYLYFNPQKYKLEDFYRCRGLLADDQQLLVNTYKGRYQVDLASGESRLLPELFHSRKGRQNKFPLLRDRQGNVWAGSDGLVKLDEKGEKELKKYSHPSKDGRLWALEEGSNGRFWLGNYAGLWMADPLHSDTLSSFQQYNDFPELEEAFVLNFYNDRTGNLWVLSNAGLYLLDEKRGITARYCTRDTGINYLPADDIQHLHQDAEGIYWLATNGAGLIRWDRNTGQFEQFDRNNGFLNNNIYAVYEDDFDHLWMSSDYGIIQFDKKSHKVKTYGLSDGLTYYEFNRTSHFQSANGRIYFGSLNGVTAFDPKDFYQYPEQDYPLILTDYEMFEGFGGAIKNKTAEIWAGNPMKLKPEERVYRLEIASLDFFNSDQINYAYQIEGNSQEWKEIKGNNITIGHLPPNDYLLRVKAKKSGNSYGEKVLEIPITRSIALHRSPQFLLCMGLFFLLAIWWRFKHRNARLRKNKLELEAEVYKRTIEIQEDKLLIEKQAEELLQQNKLKTRVFNNITHELRTPLTLILGPVEELLKKQAGDGKDKKLLQLVHHNAERLLQKVKDILDLAKLESRQLSLQEKPVAIVHFLESQVALFDAFAKGKNIALHFDHQEKSEIWMSIDQEKLKTIVHNLLSNALKFTNPGGDVTLKFGLADRHFTLEVVDTGAGIPAEDLPQIFDRFFQVRKEEVESQGGTGIGLALSHELVELMEGHMGVESELGKGSRFWVVFPKKEVAVISKEKLDAAFEKERPLKKQEWNDWQDQPLTPSSEKQATILLVEDNLELQEYLQLVLEAYQVIPLHNGQEALDWLAQSSRPVSLILSDIMMPVMDGFTLLEKLKSEEKTSSIPVIMLTARVAKEDRLKALRIGVDDYITKPFVAEELLVKIKNLLTNAGVREAEMPIEAIPNVNQQKWLIELEEVLIKNLSTRHFTQDNLAFNMHLSKRQLSRRIKKLTGLTPNQYFREIRLHQARQLLEQGTYSTIAEVSYAVGFEDQHYFSNLYFQRFAIKPIAYFSTTQEDI